MVEDIETNHDEKTVYIRLRYDKRYCWVDENGKKMRIHGHEERRWRHLETMEYKTEILARVPRLIGADGQTVMASVPWANPSARVTKRFEERVIEVLKQTSTVRGACNIMNMAWSTAQKIMQRAVEVAEAKSAKNPQLVECIGIDEKSYLRGQSYITLMYDIKQRCVMDVVEGRDMDCAVGLLEKLGSRKNGIKAVALDMSIAYEAACKLALPDAVRVYDKFHIVKLINEAVDNVRKQEHAALSAIGSDILKGHKYTFLKQPTNMSDSRLRQLNDLLNLNLKVSRAYMRKADFEWFWEIKTKEKAKEFFDLWYSKTIRSRLEPMKKLAKSLKAHLGGLLAFHDHPITNAVAEGINSKIQALKIAARGFRSFASYRVRVLFFCGKLPI